AAHANAASAAPGRFVATTPTSPLRQQLNPADMVACGAGGGAAVGIAPPARGSRAGSAPFADTTFAPLPSDARSAETFRQEFSSSKHETPRSQSHGDAVADIVRGNSGSSSEERDANFLR